MPKKQGPARKTDRRRQGVPRWFWLYGHRVPRSFRLYGHRVTVRVIDAAKWKHPKDTVGMWDPDFKTIEIRGDQGRSAIGQVFCHELVHALFDEINEHKLSRNEKLVDNLASVLHQALTSFSNR